MKENAVGLAIFFPQITSVTFDGTVVFGGEVVAEAANTTTTGVAEVTGSNTTTTEVATPGNTTTVVAEVMTGNDTAVADSGKGNGLASGAAAVYKTGLTNTTKGEATSSSSSAATRRRDQVESLLWFGFPLSVQLLL